jgi:hypothetical protein
MRLRQTTTKSHPARCAKDGRRVGCGIGPNKGALALVWRARTRSRLTQRQAISVAQRHTKALRAGRKAL